MQPLIIILRPKFADLRSNSAYGEIRCQSDGTPGTDDYPGRITFSTTDGASSVTERLRIDSSGRVTAFNGGSTRHQNLTVVQINLLSLTMITVV